MGLPGAGKTTLSKLLSARLNAVHFNADAIRANINKDLGFSEDDRIEHARRMGWLCDQVTMTGGYAIADFICPTPATRAAFSEAGNSFVVFVDRVQSGRFEDTNQMFVPPAEYNIRVTANGAPDYWAEEIVRKLRPIFDPQKPTALFVGRWQPFHDGHKALIIEGINRAGQACICVRNTAGIDENNPFSFEYIRARIEHGLREYDGRYIVMSVPNISHIFYGRDVGYKIEQLALGEKLDALSATSVRKRESAAWPPPSR
ncbi:MAG: adenylyl-sulfate kinase [Xanthobacteraceae bacterium]|nr:adenylyl-sulfate kinase [Xanthobacteraceae bacterium]